MESSPINGGSQQLTGGWISCTIVAFTRLIFSVRMSAYQEPNQLIQSSTCILNFQQFITTLRMMGAHELAIKVKCCCENIPWSGLNEQTKLALNWVIEDHLKRVWMEHSNSVTVIKSHPFLVKAVCSWIWRTQIHSKHPFRPTNAFVCWFDWRLSCRRKRLPFNRPAMKGLRLILHKNVSPYFNWVNYNHSYHDLNSWFL